MLAGQGLLRGAILVLPGLLTVWFGFNAGGFFAGAPALAAVVVAAVLLLHVTTEPRPFAGLGKPLALAVGALGLFAVWTLISAQWSDAPGRALVEFDRPLFYGLLLLLFGLLPRSPGDLRVVFRGIVAALVVLAGAAFISRALPHVLPTDSRFAQGRLSYPTTYWNATGLVAALAAIGTFVLTTDRLEPAWSRVLAAAAFPVASVTVLLTFSRGAIVASVVGLVVYLIAARPHALWTGGLASVPAAVLALLSGYGADELASRHPTSAEGVSQGRTLAIVVAFALVGAAVARALLLRADRRPLRPPLTGPARRLALGGAASALLVVLGLALAAGAPGAIHRQYDRFVNGTKFTTGRADARDRLTDPGNNGRLDLWKVADHSFQDQPLHGTGAGTFQVEWLQHRPRRYDVVDAHSIVIEPLSELGVVGFGLLALALLMIIGAFAVRIRPPNRALYGGLLALSLAWLISASIDWDWEMPAVTSWLFATGGMALAAPRSFPLRGDASRAGRVAAGAALLVIAATPLQMAVSQARLDAAVTAWKHGDCNQVVDRALASRDAVSARAEPWELIAYCDMRFGRRDLALAAIAKAIDRDPHNWEYHYDQAVVQGTFGIDPRPAARRALALNPRALLSRSLAHDFGATKDPRKWKRRALGARLLVR